MKILLAGPLAALLLLAGPAAASTHYECETTAEVKSVVADVLSLGKAGRKLDKTVENLSAIVVVEIKTSRDARGHQQLRCDELKGRQVTLILEPAQAAAWAVGTTVKLDYLYSSPRSPIWPNYSESWTAR